MRDFYEDFYRITANSKAHTAFCEQVFGRDLGQHGFADMAQLAALIEALRLKPGQCALDLGCGAGFISEYLSDCTGARITGLDYVPLAIQQAQARTAAKSERLSFIVGDINALHLPDSAFDALISIDTLYFSEDLARTIALLKRALRPGGQMAIFFGHGVSPQMPKETFQPETLAPERTPLGEALTVNGLPFTAQNFTADDDRLALRRLEVLPHLHDQFDAEGAGFIYDNRMGDAYGIHQAITDGLHVRYLYHVTLPA